jgi:ectoine hydroxylase-related dioxygenase (phytanoyl-CoA dioxygenase family)
MANIVLEGTFDGFDGPVAGGWAWRRDDPSLRLRVKLLIDGVETAERTADLLRDDLREGGIGDGRYAYQFTLPETLQDGRVHEVAIVEAESGSHLNLSPRKLSSRLAVTRDELVRGGPWADQDDAPAAIADKLRRGVITAREAELLADWRRDGFVMLKDVVDLDMIAWCNKHIDAMIKEKLPVHFVPEGGKPVTFDKIATPSSFIGSRFLEFHTVSEAAKQLSMQPNVLRFLGIVFDETPVCMQSLLFLQSTQQRCHLDYPYVHTPRPAFLAASWIALEDVHPDSGPLFYYPGSHRAVKPFDFGFGNTLAYEDGAHIRNFEAYLEHECQRAGLVRRELLIGKGDLLIWHYALAHGGSAVNDPARTRRSLVTHFSSRSVYNRDRKYPDENPIERRVNGGVYYDYKKGAYPIDRLRLRSSKRT